MKETFGKFSQAALKDMLSAISSRELAGGRSRLGSLTGQTTEKSGQALVPASLSPRQASEMGLLMSATSGQRSIGSSTSQDLQSSLESRLKAKLAVYGSPEYVLTWKYWTMPSGVPICALRASPRLTAGRGCIGWPTPKVIDSAKPRPLRFKGTAPSEVKSNRNPATMGSYRGDLKDWVPIIMGWSTPTAITNTGGAALCKWGGTAARRRLREAVGNTVLNGALNPAFPSWLMGYPIEWESCADMVTPLSRKSRKRS